MQTEPLQQFQIVVLFSFCFYSESPRFCRSFVADSHRVWINSLQAVCTRTLKLTVVTRARKVRRELAQKSNASSWRHHVASSLGSEILFVFEFKSIGEIRRLYFLQKKIMMRLCLVCQAYHTPLSSSLYSFRHIHPVYNIYYIGNSFHLINYVS